MCAIFLTPFSKYPIFYSRWKSISKKVDEGHKVSQTWVRSTVKRLNLKPLFVLLKYESFFPIIGFTYAFFSRCEFYRANQVVPCTKIWQKVLNFLDFPNSAPKKQSKNTKQKVKNEHCQIKISVKSRGK